MKVLSLDIQNFAAVGHITVALDDKGLVLIQGTNADDTSQDSNGSGKSTVPDALCWCIYGETAKGQSGDKLVNRTAKKDTAVSVKVVDEETDDVYRISRHRKHKVHKNMLRLEIEQGSGWKDLTAGTDKLTQVLVDRVMGCTLEVFAAAIYAGQEAMPDLPGMTDKQLKVLIEESAGIAQLQEASEISNRIVKERKAVVQEIAAKKDRQQSNIELLGSNRLTLQTQQGQWEVDQQAKIDAAEVELKANQAAFDNDLGDRIVKKKDELTEKSKAITAKIAGSDAERTQERALVDEQTKASYHHRGLTDALDQAHRNVKSCQHRLDHVGEDVGQPCSQCGHILEAGEVDLEASKTIATQQLDAAKQLVADAEKAVSESANSVDTATKALSVHRDSMTDVSALTSELTSLGDNKQKLDQALTNWNRQKTGVEASEGRLEALKKQVNPKIAEIEALDKQVEDIEKVIEDLEEKRVAAAKELFVAEEAFRVFSPAGVRAHILDTVTPHLNARTSHYLSTLTDGNISAIWSTVSTTAKGELREKFVIDVESKTGGETFKDLSGGEKRKVRLACAMALQDLVASRANKPIKLFIADEIDTALDPAGLERLMSILDDKSRDKGTVLVVSHSDLRDFIRNSVMVTKRGGKATIETNGVL